MAHHHKRAVGETKWPPSSGGDTPPTMGDGRKPSLQHQHLQHPPQQQRAYRSRSTALVGGTTGDLLLSSTTDQDDGARTAIPFFQYRTSDFVYDLGERRGISGRDTAGNGVCTGGGRKTSTIITLW